MGLFDDATRKLAGGGDAWARHVKPERLAGPYETHEGYEEDGRGRLLRLGRSARRSLEAAMDREALAMGALGLALGIAIGAAAAMRLRRR